MTDEQITAVKHVAATPGQRLVIALAAVYAARAKAIRELTLDEIDPARRRLTIGGHRQHLTEFVHSTLVAWLRYRHRRWPHALSIRSERPVGSPWRPSASLNTRRSAKQDMHKPCLRLSWAAGVVRSGAVVQ